MTTASCQLQHKSQLTGEACENLNKRRRKLSQFPKVMDYPYNYFCRLCALEWAILSKIFQCVWDLWVCVGACVACGYVCVRGLWVRVRAWPVGEGACVACVCVAVGVCVRLCFGGKYCCWPKAVFTFKCMRFFGFFFFFFFFLFLLACFLFFGRASDFVLTVFYSLFFAFM